ncbi:MAG TPA: ubiquinone/menaquinone biosynthesis methyltransferase [Chloroflexota bacterium]|nr:ubiquinone/menaquinone biosynthesis methyltransferase [Chloroflexota bacterium]
MPETPPTGPDKAAYVRAMFARIVPRYDRMNAIMTLGRDRAWRRLAVEVAHPSTGGRALDVGSGTGDLSLELTRQFDLRLVVALDLTPEMLAEGQRKATLAGRSPPIASVVGDALDLPFPDGSFDCVVSGFTMRNVFDLNRSLREMRRIIRPGGRAVILELTPMRVPVISQLFRIYFHLVVPWLGRVITGDTTAYSYLPASVDSFPSTDEFARMFVQAGFTGVRYRRMMFGTVALHVGAVV